MQTLISVSVMKQFKTLKKKQTGQSSLVSIYTVYRPGNFPHLKLGLIGRPTNLQQFRVRRSKVVVGFLSLIGLTKVNPSIPSRAPSRPLRWCLKTFNVEAAFDLDARLSLTPPGPLAAKHRPTPSVRLFLKLRWPRGTNKAEMSGAVALAEMNRNRR